MLHEHVRDNVLVYKTKPKAAAYRPRLFFRVRHHLINTGARQIPNNQTHMTERGLVRTTTNDDKREDEQKWTYILIKSPQSATVELFERMSPTDMKNIVCVKID